MALTTVIRIASNYWTSLPTSIPLLQLLHLQIPVNISHADSLPRAWTEFSPTACVGSTVDAVQNTQSVSWC